MHTGTGSSPSQQTRSPASGYSRSILSAIKDIPYESCAISGGSSAVHALANSAVLLSRVDQKQMSGCEAQKQQTKQKKVDNTKTTTVLKIKVAQPSPSKMADESDLHSGSQKNVRNKKSTDGSPERGRRSISCENATFLPPLQSQKTQSIGQLDSSNCPKTISSSTVSYSQIGGSCNSIQSVQSTLAPPDGRRSPSAASSTKDEKCSSSTSVQPKIRLSICSKALYACANGKLQELKALVEDNPELVNFQYSLCYRYSCLHIAAKAGDKAIVQYLLRSGANINSRDDTWSTPLHAAAKAGQMEMTKMLLELGADPSIRDAHGVLYSTYLKKSSKQFKYEPIRHSNTFNYSNCASEEDDSLSQGSTRSHFSFNSHHHNYTFQSFRKPISRAVRDFLTRK